MRLLSNYPGVKNFDKKIIKTNTDLLLNHYNDKIVKTIFILDGDGRLVYYAGVNPPSTRYYDPDMETNKLQVLKLQDNEPRFFRIEPFKENVKNGLIFAMLMPFGEEGRGLLGERGGNEIPAFAGMTKGNTGMTKESMKNSTLGGNSGGNLREGYVGFIVSFDLLVHKYIVPLKLGEKDFAWIMDGRGRLIYHPNHKDMLLKSITETSSELFEVS